MGPIRVLIYTMLMFVTTVAAAQDCYESSILSPGPFMGNNGEIFKLADGSIWEVKYAYEYLSKYHPTVIVCPSEGKMVINSKMLDVQMIGGGKPVPKSKFEDTPTPEIIESRIQGEFSGWEGETIFKLINGQIWQQIDGRYKYKYKYNPKVLIFLIGTGYEMQVEGVDGRVRVALLK